MLVAYVYGYFYLMLLIPMLVFTCVCKIAGYLTGVSPKVSDFRSAKLFVETPTSGSRINQVQNDPAYPPANDRTGYFR
jgi:hypothetical protein